MLRSLLILLFIICGEGVAGQETNTRPNLSVKAHYGVRGHHVQDGMFYGPGIQAGIKLSESWRLMLQHDRLLFDAANGRFRSVAVGLRNLHSKPTSIIQFFFDTNLALLSHQPSVNSKFNTGWEFEIGFGLGTSLSKSLMLEFQVVNGIGRIYGERRTDGDVIVDDKNYAGYIVQALQLGIAYQFHR